MKDSSAAAKRSARATVIKLSGPGERVELGLLILMMPLWGCIFPWIGITMIVSPWGILPGLLLIGASFFGLLHFVHLINFKFEFEENGIRLPGVDHRLLPYASLYRIYLEKPSAWLMGIEFVPKSILKKATLEARAVQLFEIQHLTKESAALLLSQFDTHLGGCDIAQDVRDKLANWHTKPT